MIEFKVIVDEHSHRYIVLEENATHLPLSFPEARRAVEHLMLSNVGEHGKNRDSRCIVCRYRSSK